MASSRSPRWLAIILTLSIALNLALIGGIAGFRGGKVIRDGSSGAARFAERARTLPIVDRIRLGLAFRRHQPELTAANEGVQRAGGAALAAMAATPYDAASTQQSFKALRVARLRQQMVVQTVLLDALPTLSDSSRRILAVSSTAAAAPTQ